MSNVTFLPTLGVGLSLKDHYLDDIFRYLKHIDCFEIKPEHYLHAPASESRLLHILQERIPLIAHGLYLSVGSMDGLATQHLNRLQRFFKHAPRMPWMGEHMGCTRAGSHTIPHFINIPYTGETLKRVAANIRAAHKTLPLPIVFENIPWAFSYPESTMDEPEFFRRLTDATGCGLLLDATNLYANCQNFGWDLDDYLKSYPLECVVQIHFNGGYWKDDYYVDSHSKPTPPEIWDIMKTIIKRSPVKALILERDDDTPLAALTDELVKARNLFKRYSVWQ